MSEQPLERAKQKKKKRRRRRERTPEEQARAIAEAKAELASEAVGFVIVVGGLALIGLEWLAGIVGFFWGLHLVGHLTDRILKPTLQRRWIAREVQRELARNMSAQRSELEGEHARRLEELSASIAHEIRNPITAAKSLVQQVGEDPDASDNVQYARVALEELSRVEKSITHLLRYAREEDVSLADVELAALIESGLEAMRDRADAAGIELVASVDDVGPLRGDAEQLRRALINLVGNAIDALAQGDVAAPRVEVQAGENLAATEHWIRVRDNGPGIEPEHLERIWAPFHTSKEAGTGLGLAITRKIVSAHGGSITAHSEPGSGTEFVVTLPRDASPRP